MKGERWGSVAHYHSRVKLVNTLILVQIMYKGSFFSQAIINHVQHLVGEGGGGGGTVLMLVCMLYINEY